MSSDPADADSTKVRPRATRRRDDVSRFVTRFKELTGFEVQSTSVEGLPREFLAKTAPSPDYLVRRFDYQLEPRTQNALQRHDPGRWPNAPWTFGRLLEIRGFGVFSLLDVLEILAKNAAGNENGVDQSWRHD
jgi:hypothetical protein